MVARIKQTTCITISEGTVGRAEVVHENFVTWICLVWAIYYLHGQHITSLVVQNMTTTRHLFGGNQESFPILKEWAILMSLPALLTCYTTPQCTIARHWARISKCPETLTENIKELSCHAKTMALWRDECQAECLYPNPSQKLDTKTVSM